MIDVFFCTNRINHAIALDGAMAGVRRPALILHEPWRFGTERRRQVRYLRIGIWSLRLVQLLVLLGWVDTLCVPHHRFNRRVLWCLERARQVAYLDDGLDTHRPVPNNFDLERISGRPTYFTFDEFQRLPAWLDRFVIQRGVALKALADLPPTLPLLPLVGIRHVFVESPGLAPARWIRDLRLVPEEVLVVRHPVVAKRSAIPDGCRVVEGQHHNLEASLMSPSTGIDVYFGETLALVFAAYVGLPREVRVWAQLRPPARDRLPGLCWDHASPWGDDLLMLSNDPPAATTTG
ncbi:hypothetical protein [Sphaerotilus mobilis]|uniref:Uncharacterized protein n=1 Tax=Sphaerotilus mobilis TaxID=47994 RepID=A0A4Q7LAM4_9BURK|nr:hypothetical protein [Sphaerotilus mobilis]RZS47548.1 hypothetical protein EV685_3758 [Sphaerotilus mobilis]